MAIEWVFPGATPEQKERALAAALAVFKAGHIKPETAAFARMEMQAYLRRGERGPEPHPDSTAAAIIFLDAQYAAIAAMEAEGVPKEDLSKGYIQLQIEPGSFAAELIDDSPVLNWVDPKLPPAAAN